jgi:polysaccharide biosynthesis/export protein
MMERATGKINLLVFVISLFVTLIFNICYSEEKPAKQNDATSDSYIIGANDLLNIFVWKEPDLTRDVVVMPDGKITFPLIGEIEAQGQSVTGLKNEIANKLKGFISAPEVTVIIKQSNSRKIYTIGKIIKPGPYQLEPGMTIIQALSTAGGFTEWADTKNVLIVRKTGNKEVTHRFNYQDFLSAKDLAQNIVLEPNDTIIVP